MAQKPNGFILRWLQKYSTRGWVYREGQGWIFAELTPDELSEFKSYKCGQGGVTIQRMRVRLPNSSPCRFIAPEPEELDDFANFSAYCTMPQAHPLALSRFQIHHMTNDKPMNSPWYAVEPASYEACLWADEVNICQELGCKVTIRHGYGWKEWGVPVEWKPPLPSKERVFIYAFANELTKEVYVGQTDNLKRRRTDHLRDTKNIDKMSLIQSLRAQGHELELITLEVVTGDKAYERERYWTYDYKSQGYKITNHDIEI